jgi:hypothetical protein
MRNAAIAANDVTEREREVDLSDFDAEYMKYVSLNKHILYMSHNEVQCFLQQSLQQFIVTKSQTNCEYPLYDSNACSIAHFSARAPINTDQNSVSRYILQADFQSISHVNWKIRDISHQYY